MQESSLSSQVSLVEAPLLTADNCRYCLMCRHVCPVGHVTHRETLTPHGWGLTIASKRRGLLDWNASSVEAMYSCADCGCCRAHCVTDQPLPNAIAAARADIVAQGLAPEAVYEVGRVMSEWGNPYAATPPTAVVGLGEVALFVGDAAAFLWPTALDAALLLLRSIGVDPVTIGVGRNNGYLASSLGLPDTARSLAEANLADLKASDARELLVLTPGDYWTFAQLYRERLDLEWPTSVSGGVIKEVIVLLAQALQEGALQLQQATEGVPWAYVDPTHSARVTPVAGLRPDNARYDAPRKLLAAVMPIPSRELFWRRERSHPVGDTALRFANPHIADLLTWARLEDAAKAGVELLVSEDPSTLAVLNAHAPRFGLRVQGLYELLVAHLA